MAETLSSSATRFELSEDQQLVVLLTGQMTLLAFSAFLIQTVGTALVITDFGSNSVPYVYIATSIVGSLFAAGYAALQRRWRLTTAAAVSILVFAVFVLVAWLGRVSFAWLWVSFALMISMALLYQLASIIVGGQAGQLLDIRQMKTIFPTVLSGFTIGVMSAAAAVSILPELIGGSVNLLLIAVASFALALLLLYLTVQRYGEKFPRPTTATKTKKEPTKPINQILRSRYVRVILAYQMLSTMGTYLVTFIYLNQLEVAFPQLDDLVGFIGNFNFVTMALSLLFLSLVAGRLFNRLGLRFGITANPFMIALILLLMVIAGPIWGLASGLFFWLAVSGRFFDILLSYGTTSSSVKAMYQALPADERPFVETAVEGIGVPVAMGFAGAIMLIFTLIPGLNLSHLIILTVIITTMWVLTGLAVYRDYRRVLVKTLSRRTLNKADFSLEDGSTLAVLETMLQSDKPHDVILALDLLTEANAPDLDNKLLTLLDHEGVDARIEALRRIETRKIVAALPRIKLLLAAEKDEAVLGTAVRALCALAEDDLVETAQPFLDDGTSASSVGAIVGLLRYGGISGVLAAGQQLTEWQASPDAEERRVAAEAIGEVGVANFYRPLIPLLQDEAATVRREALVASSKVHHPRLLPYVIDNLANPLTRSAAMSALVATGERLLPTVSKGLAGDESVDEADIIRMVRVCGQMKGQKVIDMLKPHIDHPDNDVQLAVLQALQLANYQATDAGEITEINRTMRGEVAHGLRTLLAKQELGQDAVYDAVHRALDHEYEEARERTFLLLSYIYDTRAILRAEEQLIHGNSASQALALETLDVTLTGEQKQMVFPLVDTKLTMEQQIKQLQAVFELAHLPSSERLVEMIADPEQEWTNGWTRACVLQAVGKLGLTELADAVEQTLAIEEHPVKETAVWTLLKLAPQRLSQHHERLIQDNNPVVRQLIAQ